MSYSNSPSHPLPRVAFFSMEFALAESLSIYSGGLGVLAGDFLRSARALSVPVVGIGILWGEGFSRQAIGGRGTPEDHPAKVDRSRLVRTDAQIEVTIGDKRVPLAVYRTDAYDNATLYLLEPIEKEDRWMTRRLYSSDADDRISQEIVLGVGGIRALDALGIHVDFHHFNEGHAVFAGLELLRRAREQLSHLASSPRPTVEGDPALFELARHQVRKKIVFTTHTPIEAGNEKHDLSTLARLSASLGFSREELVQIGGDPFNMTVAGLRLACRANAVSRIHAETARRMWRHVRDAAPISAITNGVDRRTWQDPGIREASLLTGSDEEIGRAHRACKEQLFAEVEHRTGVKLDPRRLTIGFARRATSYKRGTLLLSDAKRIERLIADGRVQILFAGKSHPRDAGGIAIIEQLVTFARRYPQSVAFLPNYDLALGQLLTRGCDIWLNTPRRPLEACGTSGMKAAMNGVLNFSVLDGWWPEACIHGENGWALGEDPGFDDEPVADSGPVPSLAVPASEEVQRAAEEARNEALKAHEAAIDEQDAAALYSELEGEILPTYYGRPDRWLQMMRASIALTERFSSDRMVRDYFRRLYSNDPSPRPVATGDAVLREAEGS